MSEYLSTSAAYGGFLRIVPSLTTCWGRIRTQSHIAFPSILRAFCRPRAHVHNRTRTVNTPLAPSATSQQPYRNQSRAERRWAALVTGLPPFQRARAPLFLPSPTTSSPLPSPASVLFRLRTPALTGSPRRPAYCVHTTRSISFGLSGPSVTPICRLRRPIDLIGGLRVDRSRITAVKVWGDPSCLLLVAECPSHRQHKTCCCCSKPPCTPFRVHSVTKKQHRVQLPRLDHQPAPLVSPLSDTVAQLYSKI